jgi:nucleolin
MSADGARKLFVGGLADSTSEVELRAVFERAGFQVEHLALPRDRETGRLRGFAFITLTSEAEASRARTQLQGADCSGRPLSIREFSQEPPTRGPGGPPFAGGPRERPRQEEQPTVFLGKLPFESTQEEIQQLFASEGVGPVTRVTLPLGPDGRPRGFGFATLASQDQVDAAVAKINGATLRGRQIVVSPAQPRGAPGAGGGARDGGSRDGGVRRGPPRHSDRPPGMDGYGGGDFGGFEGPPPDPMMFPPGEGKGGRRRVDGKKEKKEKKRGGAAGDAEGAGRASRKRRGGGGSWHQWESEDD